MATVGILILGVSSVFSLQISRNREIIRTRASLDSRSAKRMPGNPSKYWHIQCWTCQHKPFISVAQKKGAKLLYHRLKELGLSVHPQIPFWMLYETSWINKSQRKIVIMNVDWQTSLKLGCFFKGKLIGP